MLTLQTYSFKMLSCLFFYLIMNFTMLWNNLYILECGMVYFDVIPMLISTYCEIQKRPVPKFALHSKTNISSVPNQGTQENFICFIEKCMIYNKYDKNWENLVLQTFWRNDYPNILQKWLSKYSFEMNINIDDKKWLLVTMEFMKLW